MKRLLPALFLLIWSATLTFLLLTWMGSCNVQLWGAPIWEADSNTGFFVDDGNNICFAERGRVIYCWCPGANQFYTATAASVVEGYWK